MAIVDKKTFQIPEGKELKDARVVCDRHGDITKSALFFSYTTTGKNGENQKHNCIYCIPCLNEYLESLQKEGKLGTIALVPIIGDKSTEVKDDEKPVETDTAK
jgi:hypothetical protein